MEKNAYDQFKSKEQNKKAYFWFLWIFMFVLLSGSSLFAQETIVTVPDANFRRALIEQPDYGITAGPGENQVTVPHISWVEGLDVHGYNITDMTGIEAFTYLTILDCTINNIQTLDLSSNVNLRYLFSYHNQITSLNVTGCPHLNSMMTGFNLFTTLDVSQNSELTTLYFHGSPNIRRIDLSQNRNLGTLVVDNTNLDFLDVGNNVNLQELECWNCNLPELDLRSNLKLKVLACYTSHIKKLMLPPLENLVKIHCEGNDIKFIDLHEALGIKFINTTGNPNLKAVYFNTWPISGVEYYKDDWTEYTGINSDDQNPSITAGETGTNILYRTGATLDISSPSSTNGSLTVTTGTNPSVFGALPEGIASLNNQKYWTITNSGLSALTYNLVLDLTPCYNITDFTKVRILKRNNSSSPWEDLTQNPVITHELLYPYVRISGLTSFSDFAIGIANEGALPVELASFTAAAVKAGISLSWKTATEISSYMFEIERAANAGNNWTKIGEVAAAGNSNCEKQYSFTDKSVLNGIKYIYRLKQIDNDGKFEYSNIAEAVADNSSAAGFSHLSNYPNPFNPATTISYCLPEACDITLRVYDVLGQEITTLVNGKQDAGMHQIQFNASNLPTGIYLCKVTAPGFSKTSKMLLVK